MFPRIAVGLTLLLAACGGKINVEVDDGGVDDGGGDDGSTPDGSPVDGLVDVGPGMCGVGACTPGTSCSPDGGCNLCSCGSDGSWACTLRDCVDSGPPIGTCPSTVPSGYCPVEGMSCTYPNGCGGKIYASCSGSYWNVATEPCAAGCPTTQPKPGTTCSASVKCPYPNGCGGMNTAWCDGKYWNLETGPCSTPTCPTSLPKPGEACLPPNKCAYASGCPTPHTAVCDTGTWTIYWADCPPPPSSCPTKLPVDGSACTGSLNCSWDNGCGNITYGNCSGGRWYLKASGCTPGCPASKPVSGAKCSTPGSTSCTYMVPGTSSCTSSCFCADDLRWACLTPPCAVPAGG